MNCQNRAWLDTAAIETWAELLLRPYVDGLSRGKTILIWDNCGPHNGSALRELFQQIKVENFK